MLAPRWSGSGSGESRRGRFAAVIVCRSGVIVASDEKGVMDHQAWLLVRDIACHSIFFTSERKAAMRTSSHLGGGVLRPHAAHALRSLGGAVMSTRATLRRASQRATTEIGAPNCVTDHDARVV